MLDDEATDLLRRHLRRGQCAPCCVRIDRVELEREIGEARARELDTWVEVNGGWLLRARNPRGAELQYASPRDLLDRQVTEADPRRTEDDTQADAVRRRLVATVREQIAEIERLRDAPDDPDLRRETGRPTERSDVRSEVAPISVGSIRCASLVSRSRTSVASKARTEWRWTLPWWRSSAQTTLALTASGVGHGNVYTLRHTAITHMLSVGISLHDVARYVGTSVVQISKTYGHLAEGAEDAALAKLDAAAEGLGV
jgi:integrase